MSPLANQDPLAQLNDIIAPTAPNWFPPAPIYWALLLISATLIFVVYYILKKRHQQQKLQKIHLSKLADLQQTEASFVALNQLLKGCALSYFSRNEVASLHGELWFDFLQKYSASPLFGNKQDYVQRLYQVDIQSADENDYSAAKNWISALPIQLKKQNKKQGIKNV
ncbi:MAG: DUF4381 domain-containing protein [Psychromonas sp.]|nr:DUF4381 domain-containing protein [Psychromonas sp.]